MRIKGVLFLAVIGALGFLISWVSIDSMLEEEIEYQASLANGALVEIDGFDLDLIDLKIRWNKLQVANPENTMTNTFETGEMELDFLFGLLGGKRVIIEDVILNDFRMDTERETDGYFEIPESEEDQEPSFVAQVIGDVTSEISRNAQMEFTDIKTDLNVDSLMAELDLKTPDRIDSLRNNLSKNYQKWDSTFTNTDINQEIESIEKTINSFDVKKMKDPKKAIAAIKDVQKLAKQVDSLKKKALTLKNNFQRDFEDAKFNAGQIDDWIRSDFNRGKQRAKLPTIDPGNIAQSIFGENLIADYSGYLEYVAIAREYGSKFVGGEDEEKIERYKGKDYKFSDKYDWPSLWIQNIDLSGVTNTEIELAGKILNISSDQKKTKEPITFNLSGKDNANRSMTLKGELNYTADEPVESITFTYDGFGLQGTKLSPSTLLPYPLTQGTGEVSAKVSIVDKRFDSEINYSAKGIAFDFENSSSKNKIQSLIKDAISGTDRIKVTALVDNLDGPLDVKIRSNLDNLFMNALKSTISKEVTAARNKIESEVRSRIGDGKQELLAFKNQKEAEIRKEYEKLEKRVNDEIKKVEDKKKELEKKKKELEDSLKNAIRDRIGF